EPLPQAFRSLTFLRCSTGHPVGTGRLLRCGFLTCPRACPDCAREMASPQYGKGQSLSFSLAIAHSRARPCGSAIRKDTISTPKSMNSMCEIIAVDTGMPSHDGSWL